ncbi:putative quinol monooxygenase [Chitinophaga dinghuensis]|nr:putative quinol monooxygenase [Chitinophaga dinghuensis]
MLVWQLACVVTSLSDVNSHLTECNVNDRANNSAAVTCREVPPPKDTITATEKFVIAKLFIRPESMAAFRAAMDELVIVTRKEPGCIGYTYYADSSEKGAFTVIEHYRDGAGLRYHFQQDYLADFVKKVETWKSKDPEVHFLSVEVDALKDDK